MSELLGLEEVMQRMAPINAAEREAVRRLGDAIGYGRVMQLAEQIWHDKAVANGIPGSEHTTGPCAALMVLCPHPKSGRDANGHCDWCCGAGRVTKRVLKAMRREASDKKK